MAEPEPAGDRGKSSSALDLWVRAADVYHTSSQHERASMSAFGYRKPSDLPNAIPVFPLDGAVLLPRSVLPLNIFEPRYLNMIDDALAGPRLIGMVQTASGGEAEAPALARVGGVGRITSFSETNDGRYLIQLTGVSRFAITEETTAETPYRTAAISADDFMEDFSTAAPPAGFDRAELLQTLKVYLERNSLQAEWDSIESAPAEALVNSLIMACPFEPPEKQALLEAPTITERRDVLVAIMRMANAGDTSPDDLQ